MNKNLVRVNMNMSDSLKQWYVSKANGMGIPFTSLMIMALNEFKKQETVIGDMSLLLTEIQGIKIKLEESKEESE